MCGRFGLEASWEELFAYFDLVRPQKLDPQMPPRYNIPPTQPIMTITVGHDGQREGMLARWGLIPSWVKDPGNFTLLVNARTESAIEKPSFRNAMRHRRILIPASGFFEWKRFGKGQPSQAYWVRPQSGNLMAFGGLLETWAGEDGSEIDTACILTTAANQPFSAIHSRLPLVIHACDFSRWLDCKTQEPRDVLDLMKPVEDTYLDPVPVSDAVNKVSNTGREIQYRVEPTTPALSNQDNDAQLSMF